MDLSSIYILHNQDDDQIELLFEIWLLYIKIDLLIYLYMYYSDILIKRVWYFLDRRDSKCCFPYAMILIYWRVYLIYLVYSCYIYCDSVDKYMIYSLVISKYEIEKNDCDLTQCVLFASKTWVPMKVMINLNDVCYYHCPF